MHSLRVSLGVVGRMAGWGLVADAGLGLIYYPLAELVLTVLYMISRLAKGGPNNDSLTSVAMTTDPGTLFVALFLFGFLGLIGGVLMGLLGGITAGIAIAVVSRLTAPGLLEARQPRSLLIISSALAGTLPTLVVLTLLNVPRIFNYLGAAWIALGWIMFTAIPVCIVFGAAWWASRRVIAWLENQPGTLHPS